MSRSYRRPCPTPAGYGFSLAAMRRLVSRHFRRRVNQQLKLGDWERVAAMSRRESSARIHDEYEAYGSYGPMDDSESCCRQWLAERGEGADRFWIAEVARLRRK